MLTMQEQSRRLILAPPKLDYCTLAVAPVEMDTNLKARVTAKAYMYISLDDICVKVAYWWYWFPWYIKKCVSMSSRAMAVGKAKAESLTDVKALVIAGSNGSQLTSTHTEGQKSSHHGRCKQFCYNRKHIYHLSDDPRLCGCIFQIHCRGLYTVYQEISHPFASNTILWVL